ncbi:MAG: hypothetical protein JKP98_03105 [Rhodobacteraceae bacterium]|nr:hypothetical protein [Paracoccaceae bacterium]
MSDADGLGDLDYARAAWWRDATLVHTGQVYTPGQTDVGGTLTLTLAYTDGFLTDETVTVATGAVADDPTTICGTPGNDSLCGTAGNDTISGDGGADMLDGSMVPTRCLAGRATIPCSVGGRRPVGWR